jgi:hypothetical protein
VGPGNAGAPTADIGDGLVPSPEEERRSAFESKIPGYLEAVPEGKPREKLASDLADGLDYVDTYRAELEAAAADVGIPLVIKYEHDPTDPSIGIGADFDGNTLLVNPAVFGAQMNAFAENTDEDSPKYGSMRAKSKRVTGFTNGIEALFQEEMLHLASFRVLKQMHADSDATAEFETWMLEFSKDIFDDSAKNFREHIKGMYGDTPNLGLELVRTYLQFIRHTGGEKVFTEQFTGTLDQYNAGTQLKKAFQSVDRLDTLLGKVAVGSGTARLTEIATRTQEWIDKNTNAPKVKSGPKPFDQPGKDGISGEERFRMNMLSSFETEAREHTAEGTEDSKYHEYYSALIAYVERQGDPVNGITLWNHAPYVTVAVEGVATPVEMPAAIKASYDQYNDINGGLTGLDSIRKNNGNDAADRVAMKTRRNLAENLAEPDRTFSEIFKKVAVSGKRWLALQEVYKEIKNGVQFTSFQASQDADAAIENQVRNTDAILEAEPENRNVGRDSIEGEVDTGEPKEPSGDAPIVPTSSADQVAVDDTVVEVEEKVSGVANLFKNLSETFAADEELPASQVKLFEDWVATDPWGTINQILENAKAHAIELGRTEDEEGDGNDFDFVFQRYQKYVGKQSGRRRQAGGAPIQVDIEAEHTRLAKMGAEEMAALEKEAARGGNAAFQSKLYLKGKRTLERLLDFASRKALDPEDFPSGITDPDILIYAGDLSLDEGEMRDWQNVIRVEAGAQEIVEATADVIDAEDIRDALVEGGELESDIDSANVRLDSARADLETHVEAMPEAAVSRAEEILKFKQDEIEIKSSANAINDPAVKRVFTEPLSEVDPITSVFEFSLGDIKELQDILAYEATETDDAEKVEDARAAAEARLGHIQNRLETFRSNHTRKREDVVKQTEQFNKDIAELDAALKVNRADRGKILHQLEAELIAAKAKEGGAATILPEAEQRSVFQHVGAMHKMAESFATAEDLSPIAKAYDVLSNPIDNREVGEFLTGALEQHGTTVGAVARQIGVTTDVFVGLAEDMWNDNSLKMLMGRLTKFLENKPNADRLRARAQIHNAPTPKDKKKVAAKLARAERNALRTFNKEHAELSRKAIKAQIKLRTSEKVVDLFDKVSESQGFKELAFFADNPGDVHEDTARMISRSSDQIVFEGFGETKPLAIKPSASTKTREKWFSQLEEWQKAAGQYVTDWQKAKSEYLLDPENVKLPDARGFDSRVARGLRLSLDEQVGIFLDVFSIESPTQYARVPVGFSRLNSGALPLGDAVFAQIFGQLDQVLKLSPVPEAKLLRKEFQDLSRANRTGTAVNRKHADFSDVREKALEAHGFQLEEDYDLAVFQHMAILGRQHDSPIEVGYVLPSGEAVMSQDIAFLKKQEDAFADVQKGLASDSGVERQVGGRTVFRKARAVGKYSTFRRKNLDHITDLKTSIEDIYFNVTSDDAALLELVKSGDLDTGKMSPFDTFWDAHSDILQSMILDSQLPAADRNFKRAPNIEAALKHMFSRNVKVDSLEEFRAFVAAHGADKYLSADGVETKPSSESIQEQIDLELKTYMQKILGPVKTQATAGTVVDISMRSTANQFTQTANNLDLPSSTYKYGAVSSLDWAAFMSGPRAVAEVKVLEGIERFHTALQGHKKRFKDGEVKRPKAMRSDAQYLRMLDAMAKQLSLQQQGISKSTHERRLMDRTSGGHGPLGMRQDVIGLAIALVLAPPTVVAGNAPLSALGIFNIHAKMHGMINAFKATAIALGGLAGRSALQLTESAAKHSAFVVDRAIRSSKQAKVIGRGMINSTDYKYVESELGVGAVERWVDSQIEWVETSWIQKLGWATTQEKMELDAKGLRDRDPAFLKMREAHREAWKTKARRDRKMTVQEHSEFTRGDQLLSGISTLADKVGMSVLDVIVNQMSLQFAKQELEVLQSQANTYGELMTRNNPGQSYQAGKKNWAVSYNDEFAKKAKLTGNRLAFTRNFFEKTGSSYEEILWKLYVRENNEALVGEAVAVPLSDWSDETNDAVGEQKRLNAEVEDIQSRIETLFIEEVNAPSAINRSSAARLSPFFRLTQPLMGYTADFFQKTMETISGGDPDRERYKHLIEILGRLMFGAMAFTFVGLLGTQAREQVKRNISKRSSGTTIMTDAEFMRDIKTMVDPNNGALASSRIEAAVPLVTALASAMPFAGDIFLIAANHISSAHSRGHILELGGKSVAIGMMHDLAMAGFSTVNNAYYGAATSVPAGDFLHRWLPYWDVASYHVFNQTDKQKYFGGYALKTEAVKLGLAEPSRQIRVRPGVMSPDKAYEREIASAVSSRDEVAVEKSVSGYLAYLQEHKELNPSDARRRVARQLRNLSPLNRATSKRLNRREKNQLLESVTGIRREPIDAALEDYAWAQKTIRRTNKVRISD